MVKLIDLLSGKNNQQTVLRAIAGPEEWSKMRVFSQLPLTKESEVTFVLWGEHPDDHLISSLEEIGIIYDLNDWIESFDDRDDPAQEMIDYLNDLLKEE